MNHTDINIADIASPLMVMPWAVDPGRWISHSSKDQEKARTIYDQFVAQKIPLVKEKIEKLHPHHISQVHLPLRLLSIFNIYVEEQIELYQAERDERDPAIDRQWQKIKSLATCEDYKLFRDQDSPLTTFINDLRLKLSRSDALPSDFDQTIHLFQEIINTVHVSRMSLSAFYTKEAKNSFEALKTGVHLVPNLVPHLLPYTDLVHSFETLKQYANKNSEWIFQAISEILQKERRLDIKMLHKQIYNEDFPNLNTFKTYYASHKRIVQDVLTVDINDQHAVKALLNRLKKIRKKINPFINYSAFIEAPKNTSTISLKNGSIITVTTELFLSCQECVKELQECHILTDGYLFSDTIDLTRIMESLSSANQAMRDYKERGKIPPLAKDLPPLLWTSSEQQKYDKKIIDEFLKTEGVSTKNKHKNRRRAVQKTTPEISQVPSTVEKKIEADPTVIETQEEEEEILEVKNPLTLLQVRLQQLFLVHPSSFLRQALWHLDALKTIQDSYSQGFIPVHERLNDLDGMANSCGKLLEQVYHFLLNQRGDLTTIHNLKENHRMYFPGVPYPEIIKELNQSNVWTRYFINRHEKLSSITTSPVQIPTLLANLKNMAENPEALSETELKTFMDVMIRKTRFQVERLLRPFEGLPQEIILASTVPFKIEIPADSKMFQQTRQELRTFLDSARLPASHPASMNIRQAMAALQMLEASLEKIGGESNPRAFATWTSWSLQQLHEAIEDLLHGIEFLKKGQESSEHDLGILAHSLGIDMGPLAMDLKHLSYKPRYPAEYLVEGKAAELIDDLEAMKRYPDIIQGFSLVGPATDKFLWKPMRKDLSLPSVMENFTTLLNDARAFLSSRAIPSLQTTWNKRHAN